MKKMLLCLPAAPSPSGIPIDSTSACVLDLFQSSPCLLSTIKPQATSHLLAGLLLDSSLLWFPCYYFWPLKERLEIFFKTPIKPNHASLHSEIFQGLPFKPGRKCEPLPRVQDRARPSPPACRSDSPPPMPPSLVTLQKHQLPFHFPDLQAACSPWNVLATTSAHLLPSPTCLLFTETFPDQKHHV